MVLLGLCSPNKCFTAKILSSLRRIPSSVGFGSEHQFVLHKQGVELETARSSTQSCRAPYTCLYLRLQFLNTKESRKRRHCTVCTYLHTSTVGDGNPVPPHWRLFWFVLSVHRGDHDTRLTRRQQLSLIFRSVASTVRTYRELGERRNQDWRGFGPKDQPPPWPFERILCSEREGKHKRKVNCTSRAASREFDVSVLCWTVYRFPARLLFSSGNTPSGPNQCHCALTRDYSTPSWPRWRREGGFLWRAGGRVGGAYPS